MQVEAAYRLLADGKWHSWPELRMVMLDAIPPGPAKRHAIKKTERDRAKKGVRYPRPIDESEDALIYRGRNALVVSSLGSMQHSLEIDKHDSRDKVNWMVRKRPPPPRERVSGMADAQYRQENPDIVVQARSKSAVSHNLTWRERIDALSDEEALRNEKDAERAAVLSRPYLWPERSDEKIPVIRQTDGRRTIFTGYLSYNKKGDRETWTVEQTWPYVDLFIYHNHELSKLVRVDRWRALLKDLEE